MPTEPVQLRWRRVPLDYDAPGFALPAQGEEPEFKAILEYRWLLPKPHGITMGTPPDQWSEWVAVPEQESKLALQGVEIEEDL